MKQKGALNTGLRELNSIISDLRLTDLRCQVDQQFALKWVQEFVRVFI